jgi:hypothetical protein
VKHALVGRRDYTVALPQEPDPHYVTGAYRPDAGVPAIPRPGDDARSGEDDDLASPDDGPRFTD